MHAVIRETNYTPEKPIYQSEAFKEFQQAHADLKGYQGTIVVEIEPGRFITLTVWKSTEEMAAGLQAMGPVVQRTLNPLLKSPAKLIGTGPVVVNDLTQTQ